MGRKGRGASNIRTGGECDIMGTAMEKEQNVVISRFAFERIQSREERNDIWRNITIVVLIILLVVSNAMWLIAWNQYEYVEDYAYLEAEQQGNTNIANTGDVEYGAESTSGTHNTEQDAQ